MSSLTITDLQDMADVLGISVEYLRRQIELETSNIIQEHFNSEVK